MPLFDLYFCFRSGVIPEEKIKLQHMLSFARDVSDSINFKSEDL